MGERTLIRDQVAHPKSDPFDALIGTDRSNDPLTRYLLWLESHEKFIRKTHTIPNDGLEQLDS